ncbi:MAG: multicopper oxidase domain-containing protein [Gammaproteobacteria bacterium]|nr:multicopper oxidase domain-containing protein [Gammaproteobacteria bacterium]
MRRRDWFRLSGLGGVAGLFAGGLATFGQSFSQPKVSPTRGLGPVAAPPAGPAATTSSPHAVHGLYAQAAEPPLHLGPDALAALDRPPRAGAGARQYELHVREGRVEVGQGAFVDTWTYGGTAPGPVIRATEGELLEITLVNDTGAAHSLHFHGAHDVGEDGWQPVNPGERRSYRILAGPAGLHPYHCHTPPFARHFARGMYGVMIVDPQGGRPPAHERVLSLCGWDLDGDGRNELYAWNGIAGYYHRFPLKVPAGERVRLYVTNLVEYDPVASFHLHAQTFDLYRTGTALIPHEHTDVVTLGQTERAIVEFTLPRPGRYMFHPHQIHMAERGAMGWITAL